jgi:hypothetical protein
MFLMIEFSNLLKCESPYGILEFSNCGKNLRILLLKLTILQMFKHIFLFRVCKKAQNVFLAKALQLKIILNEL